MGAKLSRKKSEAGIGAETAGPETETADGTENQEQKCCEGNKPGEEKPDSSTSVLHSITQAVGETVNTVTEQIAAPVEDVVNKGIEAMESALASVSLIGKESAEQDPEQKSDPAASDVEPSLLDDLLKSPISEALVSGVAVVSEAMTGEMGEDKSSNPAPVEKECLDKVETPSLDLVDCKLTHETTIPDSDPSFTLEDMGQHAVDTVNLI